MSEPRWITELLANFILRSNVPLEAIAVAGEMIALDARLAERDVGPPLVTFDDINQFFGAYEKLLKRLESTIGTFPASPDMDASAISGLLRDLSEIKQELVALSNNQD